MGHDRQWLGQWGMAYNENDRHMERQTVRNERQCPVSDNGRWQTIGLDEQWGMTVNSGKTIGNYGHWDIWIGV